jgi:hypothetical protein
VLELYADECVDARIVSALRRRGVNVVTAADSGLLGMRDEQQLARAIELGRPIVSGDRDFLALVSAQLSAGVDLPGLIFLLPATHVGDAVRGIALLVTILDSHDMRNTIEWVP